MTNSMEEIARADVAMVIGANITWNHPVFGSMVKRAVRENGLELVVCDPRRIDLVDHAHIWLQQRNGSDVALLMGLQHIIFREGLEAKEYIASRLEGFAAYRQSLAFFTPGKVEELTGVKKEDLERTAVMLGTAGRAALYFCMGITQHSHGVDNVLACANLQMITGNVGIEGGGINPLRGQNNVQGACDMGCLPASYTGYQKVADREARNKFARCWGIDADKLSLEEGLPLTLMIDECGKKIRALHIMGENPMISDPNLARTREALGSLDFLVVQDIFLTETARMADAVLPGVSFAEKHGTFTNTERRVLLSNRAVSPPGEARQDYEIIADLAARFGHRFPRTPEGLFAEIRDLTPSYAGITHDRIRETGLQWPCPSEDHPGTRILHVKEFTRGKGLLTPLVYSASAEEPDELWPMVLSTGRLLQHFHSGSMTRRAAVLDALVPQGVVEVHPADAERIGVAAGDKVRVVTRRGRIETFVNVAERVREGTIFVPFHFAEAAANELTNDVLDPQSKIPEYKVCAARLERVE